VEEYGAIGPEFEFHERMTFLYRIFFFLIEGKGRFEMHAGFKRIGNFLSMLSISRTDGGVHA